MAKIDISYDSSDCFDRKIYCTSCSSYNIFKFELKLRLLIRWKMVVNSSKFFNINALSYYSAIARFFVFPTPPVDSIDFIFFILFLVNLSCLIHNLSTALGTRDEICPLQLKSWII